MTPSDGHNGLPDDVVRRLTGRVATTQRAGRAPALTFALRRGSDLLFTAGAGDPDDPETQFRIGSITKTFTAVLVMQCRDGGLLTLDDRLDQHLPGTPFGHVRVRDLLGHLSGLAREPTGPFWEASPGMSLPELLGGLAPAQLVLPGRRRWHYSNVAYGLLGGVVERLRQDAFPEVLASRIVVPLGLARTSWEPQQPYAVGYRTHPYADVVSEEPTHVTGAMGPAGQLWSTVADLTTWGAFLADPAPDVLHPDTAEEMCDPVAITDRRTWTAGYGLGVQLYRRGDRVYVGHGGSMPGFVAGLAVARADGVAAAACANAWQSCDVVGLACDAVTEILDSLPVAQPWTPAEPASELGDLLGPWWYRGVRLDVRARGHDLEMQWAADQDARRVERFVPDPGRADTWRGIDVAQAGEPLLVRRDDENRPVVLDVGGWLLTRDPDDPRGGP